MTSEAPSAIPTRQQPPHGVRWVQPSQHRERSDTLLRSHRHHRSAAAPGGDTAVGIDISCPQCGYEDLVQSVPAICAAGTSTVSGTDYYSGVGIASTGFVPVVGSATVHHTRSTVLATELASEPYQRSATRFSLFGVLFSLPALAYIPIAFAAATEPGYEVSIPWTIGASVGLILILAAPSIAMLWVAARRARRNGRIIRGRPTARGVWSAAFYCHRCHVGYWPVAPAPGVPVRQPLPPAQFRWVVWDAGGYANA